MFLLKNEVKFLGHIVSSEGIATDPEKVEKVLEWLNKRELQQFVNYYRRFLKDCAQISRPLYLLTEKNRPFKWTSQCQESFEMLCRVLVSAPVSTVLEYLRLIQMLVTKVLGLFSLSGV